MNWRSLCIGRLLLISLAVGFCLNCIFVEDLIVEDSVPSTVLDRLCKQPRITDAITAVPTVTPTIRLRVEDWPSISDDLGFENMQLAIDRQLKRFQESPRSGLIQFGDDIYQEQVLPQTLIAFGALVKRVENCLQKKSLKFSCYLEMENQLKETFHMYTPKLEEGDPRYGEEKRTFFTAYYTPTLLVSNFKSTGYPYPIYIRPTDEDLAQSSRHQIDFQGQLNGKGYELYYAQNLFEIYLLQVQGGGRVIVSDLGASQTFYISFAGTNKQKWRWLSTYMMEKGYIDNPSIEAQRNFLHQNPDKHEEVYSFCPSYVYFKATAHPPEGSDSVPLTDARSIATDTKYYPTKGVLAFVNAMKPMPDEKGRKWVRFTPFSRFMLDQDTGGAIEGKGRVDLYHGQDAYAELAAYNTQHTGNLYFLVLKSSSHKK